MEIVNFFNCADHYEARKKEQEYFVLLGATLNSIEPLPKPKAKSHIIQPFEKKEKIIVYCQSCNVYLQNTQLLEIHNSTRKHIKMTNTNKFNCLNKSNIFHCEKCNYTTNNKKDFNKHNKTQKHIINENSTNSIPKSQKSQYECICGKSYKDNSGLWRHKKICNQITNTNKNINTSNIINDTNSEMNKPEMFDKNLILELLKQNNELQKQIIEMSLKHNSGNITNNNSINTNCNNSFNLQFFLNDTCKDAMNMSEFIDSIKVQLSDLETFEYDGYADGVSNIIVKGLNALDAYLRPIHCSDLKRETLYIKDNNCWTKETDDKLALKTAIKKVAFKNIRQINEWIKINPEWKDTQTKTFDKYNKIVMNSMSGVTEEEQTNNINKIVKNVTKAVVIDKHILK
jgi:hypothetical protein